MAMEQLPHAGAGAAAGGSTSGELVQECLEATERPVAEEAWQVAKAGTAQVGWRVKVSNVGRRICEGP